MTKSKPKRVTITVDRHEIKKLDKLAKRFWPSLTPSKCRAGVFRALLQQEPLR
jgi:hypothetical protein